MKLTWIHYWDEAIERLDFADLDPSFKVTGDIGMSNLDQNVCLHHGEPTDGLLSKSHGYFIGIRKTSEYTFVTLNFFSRSQEGQRSH